MQGVSSHINFKYGQYGNIHKAKDLAQKIIPLPNRLYNFI